MNDHPFYRLAPFIQEYIYAHEWTELRAVQVEACRVIFETDAHLLLATGTASGKTEAAFLPLLTSLYEEPSDTIGALYIGPTKALINDQFYRLNDLLAEARIPVWEWHGDVAQSHKARLLKAPQGVLQITPESLESLLINRNALLTQLFGGLRFIVIDEVHVFMGADRGRQVLCQLARLSRYIREEPRRIGLSATLGDKSLAEQWLASGSTRSVITPDIAGGPQRVRLAVESFMFAAEKSAKSEKPVAANTADMPANNAHAANKIRDTAEAPGEQEAPTTADDSSAYIRFLFEQSKSRKCLIFVNMRGEAEKVITSLRQYADRIGSPDIYHVHHGSIAAPLREAAEAAMREPATPAIVAATVTMELGIDIGQLERVIQLDAPFSVASFLQRLGRSGRRGSPAEMWLACAEPAPTSRTNLPEQLPWKLLQAIAIIQLYLEERWIEPIPPIRYPFSLLYHQTMSTLAGMGEMSPAALAQRVLTLPPFQQITQDDFRDLLRHLLEIDHIQQTAEHGLIIGLAGEQIVRNFRFYAVFKDDEEFAVHDDTREIGSIMAPPPPGERFALAGRTWETIEIDARRKQVFVKPVKGRAETSWQGSGGVIHTRVLERMRRVLSEEAVYPYLQPRAVARVAEARGLFRLVGLEHGHIFTISGNECCILPWMGSIEYLTLIGYLRTLHTDSLQVKLKKTIAPYYCTIQLDKGDSETLRQTIAALANTSVKPEDLISQDELLETQKYDEFIPPHLLRKGFVSDSRDVEGVKRLVATW